MLSLSRKLGARLLLALVLTTTAFGVSLAVAPTASAQAPPTQPPPSSIESGPSDILDDYQNAMGQWESAATGAAATLFALLAAIEVTWTAIVMTLEKTDMQAWVATFIKKLMGIGIFWTLLKYGATWLPAIVNSFIKIGQNGSSQTALNPSSILVEGLNVSGKLFSTAGQMVLSFDFGTALCLAFAGIGIFLSFAIVCVHFVMAMVESYIVLGAGYIFLGFGGSRWTSSYVERYIGLAVNVGVRLMVLYLLIGLGQTFATQWETRAASIQYTSAGVQPAERQPRGHSLRSALLLRLRGAVELQSVELQPVAVVVVQRWQVREVPREPQAWTLRPAPLKLRLQPPRPVPRLQIP